MRGRLARHPNVTAAVLFAVLSLLFVGQGLLPGRTLSVSDSFWQSYPWVAVKPATLHRAANPGVDDAPAVIQPFTRFTKSSLPHIPLWNPHIMTGRPFLANAQSAVFSPFNIPSYVLPYFTSLAWVAALKLWTAAFGMFLLARALAMRFAGATIAGLVYGFNLWIVAWLSYPHSSVWALIPWLMLATEHMIRRPDVRGAAPLALLVGAQFLCGHPESSFHALLATSVYFVIRMVALRPDWRRPVAWFAGAMFIGLALAALVVLPFADLLLRSADIHQRANSAQNVAANPRLAVPAFFPDWYGRPTQYALNVFELGRAWYGGALALILGAVALVLRPSRGRLVIAALGAACMMVVFALWPVYQIVTRLPIFSGGHNARLAVLALFCLALLAGFGMDDIVARRGSVTRRRLAVGAAALVFALPIVYALTSGLTAWAQAGHALDVAWGSPEVQPVLGREAVRGPRQRGVDLARVRRAGPGPRRSGVAGATAPRVERAGRARGADRLRRPRARGDGVQPGDPDVDRIPAGDPGDRAVAHGRHRPLRRSRRPDRARRGAPGRAADELRPVRVARL